MSNNKNKHNFQAKECFSRMNFLYQASVLMAGKNNTLSSYYGQLCKNVGKKAVLRIDPEVKRSLCKRCSLAQRPGITADLDIIPNTRKRRRSRKSNKEEYCSQRVNNKFPNLDDDASMQIICQQCGYERAFPITMNYKLDWLDKPDSIAEVLTLKEAAEETTTTEQSNKCLKKSQIRNNVMRRKRRDRNK